MGSFASLCVNLFVFFDFPFVVSCREGSKTHNFRINFVAAKQKQINEKVASRTKKRGQELMHLIDLDVAAFDVFELLPLKEYELYIKNFGRSDTKQVSALRNISYNKSYSWSGMEP